MLKDRKYPRGCWISSLYFTQGLPFAVVTMLSTIMYKDLDVSNIHIASVTSLFFLPWVLKPLFSPFIESAYTKRRWTLYMEIGMVAIFILLFLSIYSSHFFVFSAILFFALALFSSWHDIGSDGVYLLTLNLSQQYHYVGLRNCSFQAARLFCQGGLIVMAGWLENNWQVDHWRILSWHVTFGILAFIMLSLFGMHRYVLPRTELPGQAKLKLKSIVPTTKHILQEWLGLPQVILLSVFILIYNSADAQLMRIVPLFFMDPSARHGLSLSVLQMGEVQSVGVGSFIVGSFALSFCLRKFNLKTTLRWATVFLFVFNSGYLGLALYPKSAIGITFAVYGAAQFMFGFCNSAYMAFLMQQAGHQTYRAAYYALATATMSLSFLLFGLLGGYMNHLLNNFLFFLWIVFLGAFIMVFTYYFTKRYGVI